LTNSAGAPELPKWVADLGWHLQFNINGEVIVANADDNSKIGPPDGRANPGEPPPPTLPRVELD
jgi:hypothetical protein